MRPTLSVTNLAYDVPVSSSAMFHSFWHYRMLKRERNWDTMKGYKSILRHISFDVYPGEFVAILGSSGSGKTSLLSLLAKRYVAKTWCGSIKFLDKDLGPWMKPYLGYVMQEDTLYPLNTCREYLQFTADMKLKGDRGVKKTLVTQIIDAMGLTGVGDSLIGTSSNSGFGSTTTKTGLSGGERRRVSIANEVLTSPKLLCLDECTSGLDINTANNIVHLLRRIADCVYSKDASEFLTSSKEASLSRGLSYEDRSHNVSVVASLHQPSSSMWGLFDKVIILELGNIVFYGKPSDVYKIMNSISYSIPPSYNPADFLIEFITTDSGWTHTMQDRQKLLTESCKLCTVDEARHQIILNRHVCGYPGSTTELVPLATNDSRATLVISRSSLRILQTPTSQETRIQPVSECTPPSLLAMCASLYAFNTMNGHIPTYQEYVGRATHLEAYYKRRETNHITCTNRFRDGIYEMFNYRTKYANPYWYQFTLLIKRFLLFSSREQMRFLTYFLQFTVCALFAGSLFWQLGLQDVDIANRVGALFFSETVMAFAPTASSALRLFELRLSYLREHASGTYATLPFYIACILVDVPLYILCVVYYSAITYFMIGFNQVSIARWFYFIIILFLLVQANVSFGYVFISLSKQFRTAQICIMTILSIFVVFGGPFINENSIPSYWSWMPWVSYFAYAFKGLFYNEIVGLTFECSTPGCTPPTDTDIIAAYGLEGYSLTGALLLSMGYLAGWSLIMYIIAYFGLRYRRFDA